MAKTLREAVELGDREAVLRLIEAGHDVNQDTSLHEVDPPPNEHYEESLLQMAARLGNVEMVQFRIASGAFMDKNRYFQVADPDFLRHRHYNRHRHRHCGRAVHVAAAYGQVSVIQALAAAGSRVIYTSHGDKTKPMALAAMYGHIDTIDAIFELAAEDVAEDIFEDDFRGDMEAFAFALIYCKYDVIKYFLDCDFDPDEPPLYHEPPIHYVLRRHGFRLFRQEGRDISIYKTDEDIIKCIDLLIDYGTDVDGFTSYFDSSYSLLALAVIHRQVYTLKLLLYNGADANEPAMEYDKDEDFPVGLIGFLPIHCAISAADPRCLQVLLNEENAADHIDSTLIMRTTLGPDGEPLGPEKGGKEEYLISPLHLFGDEGDSSIEEERMQDGDAEKVLAMILRKAGSSILEIRSSKDETPLHTCSSSSTSWGTKIDRVTHACMLALLRAGADVDALDDQKRTPLHTALSETKRFFRTSGISEDILRSWGESDKKRLPDSFHWGCKIIYDLLCHGSDIHKKDKDGITPLQIIDEFVLRINEVGSVAGEEARRCMSPIFLELVAAGEHKFFNEISTDLKREIFEKLMVLSRCLSGACDMHWKIIASTYRN